MMTKKFLILSEFYNTMEEIQELVTMDPGEAYDALSTMINELQQQRTKARERSLASPVESKGTPSL